MVEADTVKRDRSPSFPYVGLEKAVERTRMLHAKARRNEVRLSDAAADWGLGVKSSATLQTVAALLAFGLVEDSGSGENRKVKVSDLGWRILEDERSGVKEQLLASAALKPKLIAEYAEVWRDGRPDDRHCISSLKFDKGFSDEAAARFLRVFDETIRFTSPRRDDISTDTSEPAPARAADIETVPNGAQPVPPQPVMTEPVSVPPAPIMAMTAATAENDVKIMLDGDRLRVSAFVDLKGAKRLMKALKANIALLEDPDEDDDEA